MSNAHRVIGGTGRRKGMTLTDVCITAAVVVLALVVVAPGVANRARPQANRIKCASNLRQIALAGIMYAETHSRGSGRFPRTAFDPAIADTPAFYTGIQSTQPFGKDGPPADGPVANDVTAALYLLLRTTDLAAEALVCPESNVTRAPDVTAHANFAGPKHLSYSLNNPYPSAAAVSDGWKFDTTLSADHPFAADMNYGENRKGGPTKVAYTSPAAEMMTANSDNHYFAGQQVAYVDGHVEWQTTVFSGAPVKNRPYRDNIYANASGVDPATGRGGIVRGAPQSANDAVLLPTASDGPAGRAVTVDRWPGMSLPYSIELLDKILIVGVLLAVVAVVVAWVRRKRASADLMARA